MKVEEFYKDLLEDIKSIQLNEEDGGVQESIFTEIAFELLSETGETENPRVCFDRKEDKLGRTLHKLNGYAISENYETLDLFISIYRNQEEPFKLSKQETDSAINQVERFFKNAVYKDYVKELEESSEAFDLAHTLAEVKEIKEFLSRVNIFILTNGSFSSSVKSNKSIAGYSLFYRIIDINYLFNLSDQSHIPIEINFEDYGELIPCLESKSNNEDYETYLALFPGKTLAHIYEEYGSRLLEQNVRSFLQFTGKINKGIRKTIKEEPNMFLAFNNGIAATAEELEIETLDNGQKVIKNISDFQIVNGGQTTASLYHTWKKDKANIDDIFVQSKITVVKEKDNFSNVVNRIAEYANTQNKVSTSDLSSNKPFHIKLEKISRVTWAPPTEGNIIQTRWFYERARGQYKNARLKEGITPSKRKAFDSKNPRSQVITKELLAKYINTYEEIYHSRKIVIGPHTVVRGSQKNYIQFLNYNLPETLDNIFFEDTVSKAILFKNSEKIYGVKPNSIGDMRYITVPYTLAYLNLKMKGQINLYKIWKNQELSLNMKELLYTLMKCIEDDIKANAPGSLYGEWAKKDECWEFVKSRNYDINWKIIDEDLINEDTPIRVSISDYDNKKSNDQEDYKILKSIPPETWKNISLWGSSTGILSSHLSDIAFNMAAKVRRNAMISDKDRIRLKSIIDKVIEYAPDLLISKENDHETSNNTTNDRKSEFTTELIKKMVSWDQEHKKLKPYYRRFMRSLIDGVNPIDDKARKYLTMNLRTLKRYGFKE